MKKTIIALAVLILVAAAAADDRETLNVVTTPEKAVACVKEGCGLYTREELLAVRQQARAEALLDVARALDNKGCLRDDRT
jgi:hypothetical protein